MSASMRKTVSRLSMAGLLAACVVVAGPTEPVRAAAQAPPSQAAGKPGTPSPNDLDTFMQRVLLRRDENWRRLHDYILSEVEAFSIEGPGKLPLNGFKREYEWYVRDGYLIRSPIRFDGVTTPEKDRREYEAEWLRREQSREKRARARAEANAKAAAELPPEKSADVPSLEALASQRNEPRFVSEAYFLRFRFEPGNYYLAGRERYDGREVLRIEYYPTGLFGDQTQRHRRDASPSAKPGEPAKPRADREHEQEIEQKLNKVALITLWVDPAEYQIVKYTFNITEFDFLPARWLVRVGDVVASMTMARVLDGVWLPSRISMNVALSVAVGAYTGRYERTFSNYKKAEVGARIRIQAPERP
jgi:hypothetical protein